MARLPSGWTLRPPTGKTKYYYVRWWDPITKKQEEYSTHETEPTRAAAAAAKIYQEHLAKPRLTLGEDGSPLIADLGFDWVEAQKSRLGADTLAVYSTYIETHLAPHFQTVAGITPATQDEYRRIRLSKVRGLSVQKELSVLRQIVNWAAETEVIAEAPFIKGIPKRTLGTPYEVEGVPVKRRGKAPPLTPEQVEDFLAALPEWVHGLGVVRARFVLQYDSCQRSSTLDRIRAPEHWRPGADTLNVTEFITKPKVPQVLPLSKRSQAALEASYRKDGPIYGEHDYRLVVAEAARVTLPEWIASQFTATHLRNAGITHFGERGASLAAMQFQAGHAHPTTTNRYVQTSERALIAELERQGRR